MTLSLQDIAHHGHVRRWHTARVRREQTLGEHVGMVAMIALELYHSAYHGSCDFASLRLSNWESIRLVHAALYHDAPEIQFGDTPSPAKTYFRQIHQIELDQVAEDTFWSARGIASPIKEFPPHLEEILRHADLIEAWLFYRQEGLDPQKMAELQRQLNETQCLLSSNLKEASLALVNQYLAEVA